MALHVKLHEQFSAPLSPDYWVTDTMQGVVVSNGYARIPTTPDQGIFFQPKWLKPDGLPLGLYGKPGENWGEFEVEYKITPRAQRQSGATNANQMNTYVWNSPEDGSFKFLKVAMWSRTGTGTSTLFSLRFYSSSDADVVLYENPDIPVNTPIWVRMYLNKANGAIRLHTSTNGTTWTQRYSGVDAHHAADGYATAYLTPSSGDANKYFDVDDFIIRTSNAEVFPNNARVENSVSETELSVTHHLEVDSSSSSTNSSIAVLAEGPPKVPVLVYGFGGGWGSATGYAAEFYGSGLRQAEAATPHGASHGLTDSAILLKQAQLLAIQNVSHSLKSPALALSQALSLGTPHASKHVLHSDKTYISQLRTLEILDTVHRLRSADVLSVINWDELGVFFGLYKPDGTASGTLEGVDKGSIYLYKPEGTASGTLESIDNGDVYLYKPNGTASGMLQSVGGGGVYLYKPKSKPGGYMEVVEIDSSGIYKPGSKETGIL